MGNKVSAIHGVKSADFYNQGNAINEIWVGDVELVSRLPFGDSDLGQAGWPEGSWPKIPWHQFIIPLKRSIDTSNEIVMAANETVAYCPGAIHYIWPDTGFYSIYKGISVEGAYLLGTLFVGFSLALILFPFLHRALMNHDLWIYQRGRLRVAPPASMARIVKREYWYRTIFTLLCWFTGAIWFFLSFPLLFWSAQDMSLAATVTITAVELLIVTGLTVLYQLVRLYILRKRALAKQLEPASTDEKTAEDDPPVMTREELRLAMKLVRAYPQCDRNCACKIA